jgi:DNA-binding transcriptional regulator GbsR (MarR family)
VSTGTADGQVNQVIERLAGRITETGMPRMRARVLAALIVSPRGALTAIELGERLSISSGAVSTALQSLISIGLITREYVPGSRRDIYRVREDPWPEVFSIRSRWLLRFADAAEEDIDDLGGKLTGPGARLAEMREFARFVVPKLEEIVAAWREHRATLAAG